MPLVDRYILKKFCYFFLLSFVLFNFLYIISDFMISYAIYDASLRTLAKYYMYFFIETAYKVFPIACFIAAFMTFSQLHKQNEFIAFLSSGRSFFRVYSPILGFVFLLSLVLFWSSDRLLPILVKKKNHIYYVEIKKKPYLRATVKSDKIWYRSKNKIFHIKTLNSEKKTAEGLYLYDFDEDWNLKSLIRAKLVKINMGAWKLFDGAEIFFNDESKSQDSFLALNSALDSTSSSALEPRLNSPLDSTLASERRFPKFQEFDQKVINMGQGVSDINSLEMYSELMSLWQLKKFISKNKKAGLDIIHYETDYYFKISGGMHSFFLLLLILPFSIYRPVREARESKFFLLGLSFVAIYWVAYYWSFSLSKYGIVTPALAAWVAPIGASGLSVYLLYRIRG